MEFPELVYTDLQSDLMRLDLVISLSRPFDFTNLPLHFEEDMVSLRS